jgi:hypothetical protein
MTTPDATPFDLSGAIDDVRDNLQTIERRIESLRGVLLGAGWVAGWPEHHLYIDATTDAAGVVRSVRAAGINFATTMSRDDAERLTRNGNVRNGNGEAARPFPLLDALEASAADTRKALDFLQAPQS